MSGEPRGGTLDPRRVSALIGHARREIDDGTVPSCQLALARGGELVTFETLGDAAPDQRYPIFSVTKAVVAGAVWLLMGGGLDPAVRVSELVPEFSSNSKDAVTVEHLLTHTAGFPRAPMRPEEGASKAERLRRFARWRLDWEPGTRYEYHPTSAHWVLGEIIERVGGVDYRRFVRKRLLGPLGLDRLQLGVPANDQGDVLDVVPVGDALTPEELERRYGLSGLAGRVRELDPEIVLRYNEPEVREAGVPGSGAVGTAADVALYFQALLHNSGGPWDPRVLADGTRVVRTTLPDPFTGVPANRTRGLVVAGDDGKAPMRGFGRDAGPGTFGSPGIGGQVAWADPDSGLSFCYLTNGIDADLVRAGIRGVSLSGTAAACVSN